MSGTKRTCGGYRGRGEEEEGEKKDCGWMEWNGEFVAAQRTSLDTRHLTAGGPRTRLPGHLQEVGGWREKKMMMATLSAIMDITSHPLWFLYTPGAATACCFIHI